MLNQRNIEIRNEELTRYRSLSYDDLNSIASSTTTFIEGQLTNGNYDSEDLFGDFGYVESLRWIQEVLSEKANETGIENPTNYFEDSWQLQSNGISGPN